jgi:hypothetical protein
MLTQFDERSLYQIVDLRGLIRVLGGLVDFHPLVKSAAATPAERRERFPEIPSQLERLLSTDQSSAVTITIKYTDDGFSIGTTRDRQLEWSFFPKAKLEPERENKIRTTFRELGATPTEDYLSDRGKTRVLNYVLFLDRSLAASLCARLLREVYEMREEDELRFHFHSKNADKPT